MKILMVCLGNICRSPMAEGILQNKIDNQHLNIIVESKGTAAFHLGEAPDSRAILTLRKHGIDISKHKGSQFQVSDFDAYDLILAMDKSNFTHLVSMSRNLHDKQKVLLIMDESRPGLNQTVPDPYYGSIDDFEQTYTLLNEAIEHLVERLKKQA